MWPASSNFLQAIGTGELFGIANMRIQPQNSRTILTTLKDCDLSPAGQAAA